jgi:hypothetical protein
MKAPDILREAAALIEQPGKWCKGTDAVDAAGEYSDPLSARAVRWCALGAIIKVSGNDQGEGCEHTIAKIALRQECGGGHISEFNDTAASVEVVTEKMRAAADKLAA